MIEEKGKKANHRIFTHCRSVNERKIERKKTIKKRTKNEKNKDTKRKLNTIGDNKTQN